MLELEDITAKELEKIIDKYANGCLANDVRSDVFNTRVYRDEKGGVIRRIDIAADINPVFGDPFGKRTDIVLNSFKNAIADYNVEFSYEIEDDEVFFVIKEKEAEIGENPPHPPISDKEAVEILCEPSILKIIKEHKTKGNTKSCPTLDKFIEISSKEIESGSVSGKESKDFLHNNFDKVFREITELLKLDIASRFASEKAQASCRKAKRKLNRKKLCKYMSL